MKKSALLVTILLLLLLFPNFQSHVTEVEAAGASHAKYWTQSASIPQCGDETITSVVILSSGLDTKHPAFAGAKIEFFGDFTTDQAGIDDSLGAGTAQASLIVDPLQGFCPTAKLMVAKVINDKGELEVQAVEAAIDALVHHPFQTDVALLPVIPEGLSVIGYADLQALHARGTSLIAPVGEDGYLYSYPARYPEVTGVHGIDGAGEILPGTNINPDEDWIKSIAAPGEDITVAVANTTNYSTLTGSNVASAVVAGAAAQAHAACRATGQTVECSDPVSLLLSSGLEDNSGTNYLNLASTALMLGYNASIDAIPVHTGWEMRERTVTMTVDTLGSEPAQVELIVENNFGGSEEPYLYLAMQQDDKDTWQVTFDLPTGKFYPAYSIKVGERQTPWGILPQPYFAYGLGWESVGGTQLGPVLPLNVSPSMMALASYTDQSVRTPPVTTAGFAAYSVAGDVCHGIQITDATLEVPPTTLDCNDWIGNNPQVIADEGSFYVLSEGAASSAHLIKLSPFGDIVWMKTFLGYASNLTLGADGYLYLSGGLEQPMKKVDPRTGQSIYDAQYLSKTTVTGQPVIFDDGTAIALITTGSSGLEGSGIVAFDAMGETLWHQPVQIYGAGQVLGDGQVVIACTGNNVMALDPIDGTILWQQAALGFSNCEATMALSDAGVTIVAYNNEYAELSLLDIASGDIIYAYELWQQEHATTQSPAMLVIGDHVAVASATSLGWYNVLDGNSADPVETGQVTLPQGDWSMTATQTLDEVRLYVSSNEGMYTFTLPLEESYSIYLPTIMR